MPHFSVEYSSNLSDEYDLQELSDLIRDSALDAGIFPLGGIRVRFHPVEIYTIADGHPENAFISILVRIGAGRDLSAKQTAGQIVFDAVCDYFSDDLAGGHFMISLDIAENDPDLSFKRNSVHGRLSAKG